MTMKVMVHILYQQQVATLLLELVCLVLAMELQVDDHQKLELQPTKRVGQIRSLVDVLMQTFWLLLRLP